MASSTPHLPSPAPGAAEPLLGLRVRFQRSTLDRRLAAGSDADGTPELELRARQLADVREARDIAARLDAILFELDHPPVGLTARVPLQRDQVAAARPFLANLVQELREVERPRPEGVAQARLLLTDGDSPLYAPAHPGTLAARAWRAAHAL